MVTDFKTCRTCEEAQTVDSFYGRKDGSGVHNECKTCSRQRSLARYHALKPERKVRTPEEDRERHLRKNYGVTTEYYEELLIRQEFRCAICMTHQSHLSKRLAVDHDHQTMEVRGLLCTMCNLGIGNFRDNPMSLMSAVHYLTSEGR